jgi:integrase
VPPKRNKENDGLPTRWKLQHNAYYYRVPPGLESMWDGKKMFRLGKTLPEAYKLWAERIANPEHARTVGQLLDRYLIEVVPTKAITSQSTNRYFVSALRKAFGNAPLEAIKPQHIYQYVEKRTKKTSAHREIEILSHAYTKAVQWGYIDRHPFKGEVRLEGEAPRSRYVEDWELLEALTMETAHKASSVAVIQAYLRVKLLTSLRRGDMLRLSMSNILEDGLHVTPGKTRKSSGKSIIIEWSDELRAAVDAAKAARPVLSPLLFCNRMGKSYIKEEDGTANGWDSNWQRFMDRLIADTKVEHRFTEHDIRAKSASDAKTIEHARALLVHSDSRITDRIYRRKPERVKPLR